MLLTSHVLGVSKPAQHWIVATCHICNFKERILTVYNNHNKWDDRKLGTGVVKLKLKLPGGKTKTGRLSNVLYVHELAYNLLRVTEVGKEVMFDEMQGQILNEEGELIAVAFKTGSLYYLNCEPLSDNPLLPIQPK